MEMPHRGKRGKPNCGFPLFPPCLEIANDAIPTFPQARRRLVVSHQQRTPSIALRALAGAETTCPTYIGRVITTLVPTATLLAGFGVTAIGRIWGDRRGRSVIENSSGYETPVFLLNSWSASSSICRSISRRHTCCPGHTSRQNVSTGIS